MPAFDFPPHLPVIRARLAEARLCVLVSGSPNPAGFERLVADLFAAGVPLIQIRDKTLPDAVLAERVATARKLARRHDPAAPPLVIVNDRVGVVAAGADGVHVGATDIPVEEARGLLGSTALVGRTAHALDEAEAALAAGADYLGVGPCFPSTTKAFTAHAPRDFLAAAARLPLPVFAIGGITPERVAELAELGIRRVAVAAAITAAADPPVAARRFLAALAACAAGTGWSGG
jgi:thiamine-phosphate pyrophosphorylase